MNLISKRVLIIAFIMHAIISYSQTSVGTYSYLPARPAAPNFTSSPENPTNIGQFLAYPALTFYIPVTGFARGRVFAYSNGAQTDQGILVRTFDYNERLVHWQLQNGLNINQAPLFYPKDNYVVNYTPITIPTLTASCSNDANFALVGTGVHQIRVTAREDATINLALSQPLGYGISAQNGTYINWPAHPNTMYFYIPNKVTGLTLSISSVTAGNIVIKNQFNNPVLTASNGVSTLAIPPSASLTVWAIDLPPAFQFQASGFPFILCTSSVAATSIAASVEVGMAGEAICHQWQKRLLKVRQKLLQSNLGNPLTMVPANYLSYQNQWTALTKKNKELIIGYRPFYNDNVFNLLKTQNTTVGNHWGGLWYATGIGTWDNYLDVPELSLTDNSYNCYAQSLAISYLGNLNKPFNHYYQYQAELTQRAAAHYCLLLCKIGEAEVMPTLDGSSYPGSAGFVVGQKLLPEFHAIAPYVHDTIKEIFTEAIRHVVDRHYCDQMVTAMNQSSHFVTAFEEFNKATNDTFYKRLSRLYALKFIKKQDPAGWFMESMGPCASYIGMTNYHTSEYYRLSGDTNMKNAINRTYEFFNSTVAPEPGNKKYYTMMGGFNFGHRVPCGFFQEQWEGAKNFTKRSIPAVQKWSTKATSIMIQDSITAANGINSSLAGSLSNIAGGYWANYKYEFYEADDSTCSYVWPAERAPFIRKFGTEMVSVKRDEYYTNVYVGSPANHPFYIQNKENIRAVDPSENDSTRDSYKLYEKNKIAPYTGGGLSTFWNKDYGNSVMATNWTPSYHHGMVATVAGTTNLRYWEDYDPSPSPHLFKTFIFDSANAKLTINGRIEQHLINYKRYYEFNDGYLDVSNTYSSGATYTFLDFVEAIPFLYGSSKKLLGQKFGTGIDSMFNTRYRKFDVITNNQGYGTKILYDTLQTTTRKKGMRGDSANFDWRIDRYEVSLTPTITVGVNYKLAYHLIPINRLTKGMNGHWRWKNDAKDNSGYDLNGNQINSPSYSVTAGGCNYIEFNGSNQYVESPDFKNSNNELTMTAWIKSNTATWNDSACLVSKRNAYVLYPNPAASGSQKTIEGLVHVGGTFQKVSFDLSNIIGFNINDWHMYSVTYSSTNGLLKLFVDDQAVNTKTVSVANKKINIDYGKMYFGKDDGFNRFFNGKMGEVRLYSEMLHDSLIKEIYDLKKPCYPSLVQSVKERQNADINIKIYPNPAHGKMNLVFDSAVGMYKYAIYSLEGKLISEGSLIGKENTINVEGCLAGMYIIRVFDTQHTYYTKILIN